MNYRTALAVLGAAIILPTLGSAQLRSNVSTPVISNQAAATPLDYSVSYFRNLNIGAVNINGIVTGATSPEDYIDIVNPGSNGAAVNSSLTGVGSLCALIYVVDEAEEIEECCGCLVTPDQLLEIPVQANLLANPNNASTLHNGAIKLISSAPTGTPKFENDNSVCNAGVPNPTPELLAWMTHTRAYAANPGSNATLVNPAIPATQATLGVTEEEFQFAPLSAGEQATLAQVCSSFNPQSSGHGVCACPTVPAI